MNCREVERRLSDHLDGILPGRKADQIAEHLGACPDCRRRRDTLRALGTELRQPLEWPRTPETDRRAIDSWLAERESDRIRSSLMAFRRPGPRFPARLTAALGTSAALLLLAALGVTLLRTRQEPSAAQPSVAVAPQKLPQVSAVPPSATGTQGRRVGITPPPALALPAVARCRSRQSAGREHPAKRRGTRYRPPQPPNNGGSLVNRALHSPHYWGAGGASPDSLAASLPGGSTGTGHPHPPVPTGGDLASLNGNPVRDARWWAPAATDDWNEIEARVPRVVRVRDDFVQIPLPRLADTSDRQIAAAVASYKREAAVVDTRLAREVTVQEKATALSDLCDRLREATGIQLTAGSSVSDEKVTLFCKATPLRDVMRSLSRPFGYTWLRTRRPALGSGLWALGSGPGTGGRPRTEGPRGSPGSSRSEPRAQSPEPRADYSYELVQDLRSQLLEEELRNRDRREALLALDRDLQRYRPLLGLTPDQALARSRTASGAEKAMLEMLAWPGWAGIQIYFRLSAPELADLREGRAVTYSGAPRSGERPLPADVGRGILQTMRDRHLIREGEHYTYTPDATAPGAVIPPDLPDARGRVRLAITQSEVGQFTLNAQVQYFTLFQGEPDYTGGGERNCGTGMSTDTLQPNNRQTNAALAGDPGLRRPVTVQPVGSRQLAVGSEGERPHLPTASKVTTADVLEALHRATGRPIVGDFYTRLYKPEAVSARNLPLFDALNQLGDATRLRWRQDGAWLQLRTTNYYDERLKEVPNRLLSRWAEARRRQGMLSIEEVVEIAQLSDAQLDAADMAEGAREWWGLAEWDLARQQLVRPHLRFLAGFTPAQRQEAMGATGILFSRMTLAQQQRYLALGLTGGPLQSLEDLDGATLRVEYTQPGWFQWGESGWSSRYTRWVVPLGFTRQDRRVPRPPVRERTREATLQAVRRVDPQLRKALLEAACRTDERLPSAPHVVEEDQVVPTTLDLAFIYIPGSTNARSLWELHPDTCGQVGGFDQ